MKAIFGITFLSVAVFLLSGLNSCAQQPDGAAL